MLYSILITEYDDIDLLAHFRLHKYNKAVKTNPNKYKTYLNMEKEFIKFALNNGGLYLMNLSYAELIYITEYASDCKYKITNVKYMSTDITPTTQQECQQSTELYDISYTKVIIEHTKMTKNQIMSLLNNPNVKSINIKK